MRRLRFIIGYLTVSVAALAAGGRRVEFSWPTPNPAWADGRPPRDSMISRLISRISSSASRIAAHA